MDLDRTFLKRLWNGEPKVCPKCGNAVLVPLHKRRKDSNDWQCTNCNEVYRTINILSDMLDNGK